MKPTAEDTSFLENEKNLDTRRTTLTALIALANNLFKRNI